MNSKNIASLASMLTEIGFENTVTRKLLQHICFKPPQFELTERLLKGKDWLTCTIFFESINDGYTCNYYDVSFLKELEIPDLTMQAVSIRQLDQQMAVIEWDMEKDHDENFNLQDESTWQREQQIEKAVTDLLRLSATNEGKYFADYLKVKYWSGVPLLATNNNLNAIQSKFEVSQRFYFFDGKGISIEEAHRFLLNRWLEKKVHSRKKKDAGTIEDLDSQPGGSNDKGLLQKKRKRRSQKIAR